MNKELLQDGQIYVCASCGGVGEIGKDKCRECQGLGVVLWLKGEVYYWRKKISRLGISHENQVERIKAVRNALFFAFGFAGLIALGFEIFNLIKSGIAPIDFVERANDLTRIFWVSVLADMYVVYRLSTESKVRFLVRRKIMFGAKSELSGYVFDWRNIGKYKKNNIAETFEMTALKAINDAWQMADKVKHAEIGVIHMFIAGLKDTRVNLVFARLGIEFDKIGDKIRHAMLKEFQGQKVLSGKTFKVILLAGYLRAYNSRKPKVTVTDLLYATANMEGIVRDILYEIDITEREINHVIEWVDLQRKLIGDSRRFRYHAGLKPKNTMNRAYTAIATPNLDRVSRDMTLYARAGAYEPLIGREREVQDIFRTLSADKIGAVLVGPSGVGKKTIVEGIAQMMVEEDVPQVFQDKRLVSVSVTGLVAGAAALGELEGRVLKVLNEVARSKNIVLFIEDVHHLVGVGAEGGESMDIAEALAEQMQNNNFHVLATTTQEFYQRYIEKSSLSKVLVRTQIDEPNDDEAIRILESKALFIEPKEKVYFSYLAIEDAVKFTKRFMHDTYLPEKAIRVMEEAAIAVKNKRGERAIIFQDDVAEVIASLTNVPVKKIEKKESEKLLNLETRIHEKVVGQEMAVNLVAAALRRARTELRGQNRPIASFLFLGSTGVGKTQVAKTLAEVYFGSEKNMVRVDMSEYQDSDALAKLIGDSRLNRGGYLTEAVNKTPFTLVLLDEIEKAHSDILNVFLQVLDDGRLTDATGKTIDFTNAIIIGTSNAGTQFIQDELKAGKELEEIRRVLIDRELKNYFKPEFLNRFDGIVVFEPLNQKQVEQITQMFLNNLAGRLEEQGIGFAAEVEAVKELAQAGFDPTLGARPLLRVIQDKVEDNLAKLILEKRVDRRDKVILQPGLKLEVVKAEKI